VIPVYLKFRGITSYRNEAEIDFKSLIGSGIFGIFGKVGSGKSSILDAITYAIYGYTDRLAFKGAKYNLMNLKSNGLEITFEFIKGGKKYRTEVFAKRNSKDFEDISTPKRNIYVYEKNRKLTPLDEDPEDIIGLNYDNFKRTIIIPQGKFNEFLRLKPSERTRMMQEIFNLDRFDLFSQASKLFQKNENKLSELKGKLIGLEDITKERLDKCKTEVDNIAKEKNILKKEIEEIESKLRALEQIKRITTELKEKEDKFKELKQHESKIEKLKKQTKEFEECNNLFKPYIDNLDELRETVKKYKEEFEEKKGKLKKNDNLLKDITKKFEEILEDYERRDEFRSRISDFKKSIEVVSKVNELKGYTEKLKVFKNISEKIEKEQTVISDNITKNNEQIAALNGELKYYQDVSEATKKFSKLDDLLEQKSNLKAEIENFTKELGQRLKEAEKLMFNLGSKEPFSENKFKEIVVKEIASVEDELKKQGDKKDELSVRNKLEEYADWLKEGSPCPLCGSTIHPDKLKPGDAKEKLKEINKNIEELKNKLKKLQEIKPKGFVLAELINNLNRSIKNTGDKIKGIEKGIFRVKKEIEILPMVFSNLQEAEERLKELNEKNKQLNRLIKDNIWLTKRQKEIKSKNEKAKTEREGLLSKISAVKGIVEQFEKELKDSGAEGLLLQDADAMQRQIKEIEDKLESLEENYKSSKNKKEKYQETSIRLSAEIESLNKNIKDRTHKVEKKAKELEHLIKEKGYKSIEKIKEILKKSIDIEEAKKEIENYDKSLVELKISINNLKSQLEGKVFDESEFIKVSDSHKKAQDNWELITRKEGELKNEKKMIESKLMEKEQIEKNLKKLEVRGELIKKVRKLLEGKKFVKYISLVFLKNLISIANKRFRKFTKEQLRLEFDENGEIIVRDYLNDGYSRSINTLSGGQMFQASFSMSLALASMANKEDKSFFFMDEGFGSQDKDSLSIILNTIKSLRKENKIIGIISHLDELQYEIDTYILVKHSEKIGSSIESNL